MQSLNVQTRSSQTQNLPLFRKCALSVVAGIQPPPRAPPFCILEWRAPKVVRFSARRPLIPAALVEIEFELAFSPKFHCEKVHPLSILTIESSSRKRLPSLSTSLTLKQLSPFHPYDRSTQFYQPSSSKSRFPRSLRPSLKLLF